MLKLILIGF
jgi:hypothetical protein